MTHLPISPILNAVELMTHLEFDVVLMTHPMMATRHSYCKQKASCPQEVSIVDKQNPAANHFQNMITRTRGLQIWLYVETEPESKESELPES